MFLPLGWSFLPWSVLYTACELLNRTAVPAFASVTDQSSASEGMRFELHVALFFLLILFLIVGCVSFLGVVFLSLGCF